MYTFVTAIPLKPTVWSNVCRNRPRRHGYACLAGVDDPLAGRPYWPVSDQCAVWSVGAACSPLRHDHSNLLARRAEETTMGEGERYVDDLTSRANVNIDLTCVVFISVFCHGFWIRLCLNILINNCEIPIKKVGVCDYNRVFIWKVWVWSIWNYNKQNELCTSLVKLDQEPQPTWDRTYDWLFLHRWQV